MDMAVRRVRVADGRCLARPGDTHPQMLVNGAYVGQRSVLVVVSSSRRRRGDASGSGVTAYRLLWDSAWERPPDVDSDVEPVP